MKRLFTAAVLSFLLLAPAAEAAGVPADFPKTSRRGDDLIMRFGKTEKVVKDFLYDIREGQIALFYLRLPKRGKCALDVDWQGRIVAARCEK
jgi:hypothetical protein